MPGIDPTQFDRPIRTPAKCAPISKWLTPKLAHARPQLPIAIIMQIMMRIRWLADNKVTQRSAKAIMTNAKRIRTSLSTEHDDLSKQKEKLTNR